MKKYFKKIFLFIILLLISLTTIFYVKADSGWDSDYGGSDWGGSDYSSSWGSDYDSDSGPMGLGEFIIFMSILSPIIVILIIVNIKQRKTVTINNNPKLFDGGSNTSYKDISDDDYNKYFNMDKGQFKNKIKNNFINVQTSWMNFNYDDLRKLCTDELYNQYKTLLEALKIKSEQNIMSDFEVKKISIYNIKKINNITEISVYLDIEFRDYVINTNTKKIVRGNKNVIFNNCYELTYVMSDKDKLTNCPSCGAQLEVVSSNVCQYCKNTIVQTSNEIVLSKKKIVSSRKW